MLKTYIATWEMKSYNTCTVCVTTHTKKAEYEIVAIQNILYYGLHFYILKYV